MSDQKAEATKKDELLARLPAEWPDTGLRAKIRRTLLASDRKVVVLDDDPTGTQTVHGLPVLTGWSPGALAAPWDEAETCFYILTNSRRYPLQEAMAMNQEIAGNLARVARYRGTEPLIVSRSDSTLRGHYPGEVSALAQALEQGLGAGYEWRTNYRSATFWMKRHMPGRCAKCRPRSRKHSGKARMCSSTPAVSSWSLTT